MKAKFNVRADLREPDQKRRLTHGLFTGIAPEYDRITPLLSLGRDRSWKRALIRALPDFAQPCCLDLACGTGDLAFLLARRYPAGHILGLDLTEKMLELARQRNDCPNVSFACADMAHTSQAAASMDIVTGGYALRNASDIATALDEIARILKPGGVAAFLDFSKPASRLVQGLFHVPASPRSTPILPTA
ncbi:MAG: class I SAM-dependent methyltransferase [Kiritimatiellaeota bacterium]|nr:class I SAM-dependent methyltransferase [Kiritimatiellota bacterium]